MTPADHGVELLDRMPSSDWVPARCSAPGTRLCGLGAEAQRQPSVGLHRSAGYNLIPPSAIPDTKYLIVKPTSTSSGSIVMTSAAKTDPIPSMLLPNWLT